MVIDSSLVALQASPLFLRDKLQRAQAEPGRERASRTWFAVACSTGFREDGQKTRGQASMGH